MGAFEVAILISELTELKKFKAQTYGRMTTLSCE